VIRCVTCYDRLPEIMQPHARDYVERHQPVGGFLTAVLSNDLVGAFGAADPDNRAAMHDWCLWLWNDIPGKCWGSRAKVEAWLHDEDELGECEGCGAREGQPCNPEGCDCDGCNVVVGRVVANTDEDPAYSPEDVAATLRAMRP